MRCRERHPIWVGSRHWGDLGCRGAIGIPPLCYENVCRPPVASRNGPTIEKYAPSHAVPVTWHLFSPLPKRDWFFENFWVWAKKRLTTNLTEELLGRLWIDSARWVFTRSETVLGFFWSPKWLGTSVFWEFWGLGKKNRLTTNLAEELLGRLRTDSARWDFTRSEKVFGSISGSPKWLGTSPFCGLLKSQKVQG